MGALEQNQTQLFNKYFTSYALEPSLKQYTFCAFFIADFQVSHQVMHSTITNNMS